MSDVQMFFFMCGMRRVLESEKERAVLMESRHGESQTDKQGLYLRKKEYQSADNFNSISAWMGQ